ncbi:hypothetical protein HDU76_007110 [Blyttiomyces sp. JEL0837]|nr:hypothetical protein HDU76_007110 [Blyttiomyces sp. JEL0837]
MTSTTSTCTTATTQKESCLWDRLPTEIKDQIFEETDIPTRFINNQPLTESEIHETASDIWVAVVKTNSWDLDLTRLPRYNFPTILNGLDQVTSRDLYQQLCQTREELAGMNHLKQLFESPKFWSFFQCNSDDDDDDLSFHDIHDSEIPKLLIHIPMRQYWMDDLNALNDLDQLKLLFVAGCCGHLQLFQHLYKVLFRDQHESDNINTTSTQSLSKLFSSILCFAAKRGYMNVIEFILAKVNININDNNQHQHQHEPGVTLDKELTNEAIYTAFESGHMDITKLLLPLPNEDPTFENFDVSKAVIHLHVIKFLFSEIPVVDVISYPSGAFYRASEEGYIESVKFLLSIVPSIARDSWGYNQYLKSAAANGHFDVLKLLLSVRGGTDITGIDRNYYDDETLIAVAAANGHFDIVNHLVWEEGVDPSAYENSAVRTLAAQGNLEAVKFLLTFHDVDPTGLDNGAFREAARGGHLEVVKLLSAIPGVDATARDNEALREAAGRGHLQVVKFLLTIPGVDRTGHINNAVRRAALSGHADVVKLLLTYPGVHLHSYHNDLFDGSFDSYYGIGFLAGNESRLKSTQIWLRYCNVSAATITEEFLSKAIDVCELDVVKLLVEFPGVDVTCIDYDAVRGAASHGRVKVVEYLMSCPGIDATAVGKSALEGAASRGHVNLVELLLNKYDSDASAEDSIALRLAAKEGHIEIVKMLLAVPGVDATATDNEAFVLAAENGHVDVVQLLLENVDHGANEFVGMVAEAGAEEFVGMFGEFDRDADKNEILTRRTKALDLLRATFGKE